ncbi:MAG: phosphoribosylamine--glycine ligase [Pseudomonadota bacterium]
MRVLVVGSGGREHALVWALEASPLVDELHAAPGNPGIAQLASCLPIAATDVDALVRWSRDHAIDLVVVGPEAPLELGLVDALEAAGVPAFGPSQAAARLETSKAFAKAFCARHGIPTAGFAVFEDEAPALDHLERVGAPIVVKADGLAAGKGVVVAEDLATAQGAVRSMFAGQFGAAGARVVLEACLVGEEASLFALCDGTHALEIGTAQDHKRIGEGDTGPNTGGMGAYSPAPQLTPALIEQVMAEIVRPTLAGMAAEGYPFKGFLYCGLMLTADGPQLIEYNVRFGDPECQVVLPRLKTDLAQLLLGAVDGMLQHMDLRWHPEACLGVVLANAGYPEAPASGDVIQGLDRATAVEGAMVFHAGTSGDDDGVVANGGRVLCVTATGTDLPSARDRAYEAAARIAWPNRYLRRDIGWRVLGR